MSEYVYKKVDAFTSGNSLGNPAAYLQLDKETLTAEEMLKVGKEHAGFVSEVVFCSNSEQADVKLTYYSSECEVGFCGHGTIATMYDLIKNTPELLKKEIVTIETNRKGILSITNKIATEDAIYVAAPAPLFLTVPVSNTAISEALQIDESKLSKEYPIDFIDAGLRTLLVPIDDFATEISIYPEEQALKEFCMNNGIDIILVFSKEASSNQFMAHTRVFAPKFGYLEDPATGSGNSAFANYLYKNHLWDGQAITVEQGGDNIVFNTVRLMLADDQVLFGGSATVKIYGKYIV